MNKEEEMQEIASFIVSCTKCDLCKTRTHVVVGEGSQDATIMFIGEAPGYHEDMQGRPFVGKAGKILDELLSSIDLQRKDVFIANILKCRPPNNRNPLQSEIKACVGYLNRQIECIKPKILVPMGSFATSFVFEKFGITNEKISSAHGKIFRRSTIYGEITIIPMYHPAAATYNPRMKILLENDFRILQEYLSRTRPSLSSMQHK
jgi:uracil-DNA glycosylase family 4